MKQWDKPQSRRAEKVSESIEGVETRMRSESREERVDTLSQIISIGA